MRNMAAHKAGFQEFRRQGETNSMPRQIQELNDYKVGAGDRVIGHARECASAFVAAPTMKTLSR
jgi:hypothetical protein